MTKFISFFVSIFMFLFSWIIPSDKPFEPSTIEIDGVTYQNGFVADNMHLNNDYNLYKEKPVYSKHVFTLALGYWDNYYQIEDNWIFRNEKTSWSVDIKENLFCPIDEWESLHSYYEDGNNYNHYYEVQIENGYFTKYDVPNADIKKFDEIIQFSVDNEYGSTSNNKAETITVPNSSIVCIRFYKDSNDGLFKTHTSKFTIYDGHLYLYRYSNLSSGTDELAILPDELETYFVSLLKSAGLKEYFK